MGAPAPVPPMTPRRIAFRQGLIFGGGLGIIAVLFNICLVFLPGTGFYGLSVRGGSLTNNLLFDLLALLAFFFAGWRSAQQTGQVDLGGLAGFWAGVVCAVLALALDIILPLYQVTTLRSTSQTEIVTLLFIILLSIGRDAVLALLLGAGLGVLGGFVGRAYAAGGQAVPPQPNQPPASPAAPPAPAPQPPQSQP